MYIFHQPQNSIGNHSYNVTVYDNVNFGLHFHKNYEVIYVIDGKAICCVNGKTKIIEQGEFALCLSNEIHSIKSLGESRVWIGVFSVDFINEFAKHQSGKSGVDFAFRCSAHTTQYLLKNLIQENPTDIFVIKSCLYALCSEYLKQISLEKAVEKTSSVMGSIVEYVESNYKNPITLTTISQSLGYDYYYFSKIFSRLFSMNFNEYLNIYRFNEACALLIGSDLSITEVSYESGFQSVRSFNNTFKRYTGVSPSEWRCNNFAR